VAASRDEEHEGVAYMEATDMGSVKARESGKSWAADFGTRDAGSPTACFPGWEVNWVCILSQLAQLSAMAPRMRRHVLLHREQTN
jgi:hypothetical protein